MCRFIPALSVPVQRGSTPRAFARYAAFAYYALELNHKIAKERSWMVRLGDKNWELHRGPKCPDCEPVNGLRDRFWATQWLRPFKNDPLNLQTIRRLISENRTSWALSRTTNVQAIEQMAMLLRDGRWHVHAPVLTGNSGGSGESPDDEEEDEAEIVPAAAASRRSSAAPPPKAAEPEEGSLPRNADEAAIAEKLKLASKLNLPFCEECAKAAQKRAPEAA
jgi:hypothetical protein